jgi:hypothetical protein
MSKEGDQKLYEAMEDCLNRSGLSPEFRKIAWKIVRERGGVLASAKKSEAELRRLIPKWRKELHDEIRAIEGDSIHKGVFIDEKNPKGCHMARTGITTALGIS